MVGWKPFCAGPDHYHSARFILSRMVVQTIPKWVVYYCLTSVATLWAEFIAFSPAVLLDKLSEFELLFMAIVHLCEGISHGQHKQVLRISLDMARGQHWQWGLVIISTIPYSHVSNFTSTFAIAKPPLLMAIPGYTRLYHGIFTKMRNTSGYPNLTHPDVPKWFWHDLRSVRRVARRSVMWLRYNLDPGSPSAPWMWCPKAT